MSVTWTCPACAYSLVGPDDHRGHHLRLVCPTCNVGLYLTDASTSAPLLSSTAPPEPARALQPPPRYYSMTTVAPGGDVYGYVYGYDYGGRLIDWWQDEGVCAEHLADMLNLSRGEVEMRIMRLYAGLGWRYTAVVRGTIYATAEVDDLAVRMAHHAGQWVEDVLRGMAQQLRALVRPQVAVRVEAPEPALTSDRRALDLGEKP